jgi:acetyltransferase
MSSARFHPLHSMFNPASVAMIGASSSMEKMGGRRWKTLVEGGFSGPLYPINPGASEVRGHKAYKSIRDVPGPVDLAVVIVAPEHVPGVVTDCAGLSVKNVVVVTAGFGEVSEEGKRIERELVRTMRQAGGRMVGPNCSGLFSAPGQVNVGGWDAPAGRIGLVSQSGNMALDFCQMARECGIGFSRYITIGNAADVRTEDMLDYLLWDDATDVILAYIEGFGPQEGRRLFELVRAHGNRKPIVILKPGRSETGRSAALSHTGSLAGEDRVVDAAFRQCGIIRVGEVKEAWELALALSGPAPATAGVAVLTDGGGHATLFCDAAGLRNLTTPRPDAETTKKLRELLPPRCPLVNPIDFAGVAEGDPSVIPKALALCLADPQVGSAVIAGHFGGYHKIGGPSLSPMEEEAAHGIVAAARRYGKPVLVHSVHAQSAIRAHDILRSGGIPVCREIEMPAKILDGLRRATMQEPPAPAGRRSPHEAPGRAKPHLVKAAIGRHGRWLAEPEAREVLASYGIDVPPSTTVATASECVAAVSGYGICALKLVSAHVVHKTEVGGVILNVVAPEAEGAFRALLDKAPNPEGDQNRVLVTPMICKGTEFAVGAFRDPQFGPVVMVGLGGVHVELLRDVAFRLAPLGEPTAREQIRELRSAKLFSGYRGKDPLAEAALADLLVRISELIGDHDEIDEIDINPVFVDAERALVADVRIVMSKGSTAGLSR